MGPMGWKLGNLQDGRMAGRDWIAETRWWRGRTHLGGIPVPRPLAALRLLHPRPRPARQVTHQDLFSFSSLDLFFLSEIC